MSPKTESLELHVPPATPQASNRSKDTDTDDVDENYREKATSPIISIPHLKAMPSNPLSHSSSPQLSLTLTFEDFVDLQSRLVLLPYNDEDCTGAVIESYKDKNSCRGENHDTETSCATQDESSDGNDEGEASSEIVGSILTAIPGENNRNSQNADWTLEEFATIFSAIRLSPTPIVLKFDRPHERSTSSNRNNLKPSDSISMTSSHLNDEDYEDTDTDANAATSTRLAVKAKAWKYINMAQEKLERQVIDTPCKNTNMCGLYLQTSSGKCIHLQDSTYCDVSDSLSSVSSVTSYASSTSKERKSFFRKSPPIISNTSVLVIRSSTSNSCPKGGFKYQWYRSYDVNDNDETCDSSTINSVHWVELSGATHYVFQPSASDIGHRVKCIVTVENNENMNSDEEVSYVSFACELTRPIEADKTLYDVAMKSFETVENSHVAVMRNIIGCGSCEGSQFAIHVSATKDDKSQGLKDSAMRLFEVFEGKSEPLHNYDIPLNQVTTIAHPSKPSSFSLSFSWDVLSGYDMNHDRSTDEMKSDIESTSISAPKIPKLSAFCSDNKIELQASSRLARESILLIIGIASFQGALSTMDATTISLSSQRQDQKSIEGEKVSDVQKELSSPNRSVSSPNRSERIDIASSNDMEQSPVSIIQTSSSKSPFNSSQMIEIESALEKDLILLQQKLDDKNRKVTEVQDRLDRSHRETENFKAEYRDCQKALRLAEKKAETLQSEMQEMKVAFESKISAFESDLKEYEDAAIEQGKKLRSLMNEKSILNAEKMARDSKLTKMAQLQTDVNKLNDKVKEGEELRSEMSQLNKKYHTAQKKISTLEESEKRQNEQLCSMEKSIQQLNKSLEIEKTKSDKLKKDAEDTKIKYQHVRTEKSMYKQKAESLAKEMTRICRNGMGIDDIEKLIHNHKVVVTEVNLLKAQKKKALEELKEYRTAYEDARQVQEQAGIDGETLRALGQRAELERVVSELTEILHAKEMQLETMKDVNKSLSEEITYLIAKQGIDSNEV